MAKRKAPVAPIEQPAPVKLHVRWMIRCDIPEVLHIEQQSFEFNWVEEDFLRVLRQRNCIGMVAEHGEKVIGYMIYELHTHKLKLLNFAVDPTRRRQGIGAVMVDRLLGKLSSYRRTTLEIDVRETNLPAQMFFRAMKFEATGIRHGFYDDTGEDCYLMQYRYVHPLEPQ